MRVNIMQKMIVTVGLAVIVACFSTAALAQQPMSAPRAAMNNSNNRHLGFFLRPDLGLGYLSASETAGSTDVSISGLAGTFGLDIGGAFVEDWIIGVHVYDAVATNPTVSVGSRSGTAQNASLSMLAIGPSLTHYFQPTNVYFTFTPAVTTMTTTRSSGASNNTDIGFGAKVAIGKEWWVSEHWGLGLNTHAAFSTNGDPIAAGGSNTLSAWSFGLAFSATYN